MPPAIQCHDLRKTYDGKVEAVRGLTLEIQAGECFGLLGPNGAGKTTTIEILEGLLEPTSGQVTILGQTWKENARELREAMGISLQETRLSEKLSVLEPSELFAGFYRQPRAPREVLEQMQLKRRPTPGSASFRERSASALPWLLRWWAILKFFFLTSRPPALTLKAGASCGTLFATFSKRAERFSSQRTIWTKPSACATAWPLSIMDK